MTGRLVSALVCGEPDLAQRPLRRTPIGLLVGLMVGVLVVAVLAVIAIVHPGGATRWRQPGTLIVDKQTGTRYVLAGGQLRPVLNYASARLLLGARMTVAVTPTSSLSAVPRGAAVGIAGAPDSLPAADRPDRGWLVCAVSRPDSSGAPAPALWLGIGTGAGYRAEPVPDDRGVLVRAGDGTAYLAWKDRRLRLSAPWAAAALGYDAGVAVPVRDAWVNALPAGPDLGPLAVDGRGAAGPDLDGASTVVGQVFVVRGLASAERYYLLTGAGLLPVSRTGAALALGDPATGAAYPGVTVQARELSPAALASAAVLPAPAPMADLPPAPPALLAAQPGLMPCVRATAGADAGTATLVTAPAGAAVGGAAVGGAAVGGAAVGGPAVGGPAVGGSGIGGSGVGGPGVGGVVDGPLLDRDALTADLLAVRPGGGLLARTMPAPGVGGAGLYLVTEPGVKYPVADGAAAQALGYQDSAAVRVPASLLSLLPSGPVLHLLGGPGGDAAAP
jgi:type VII secretion protein EccB